MSEAIGSILPLALGVAISPVPIIAVILLLLSPRARSASVGFLLGWVAGIVVAVIVFTLLAAILPEPSGGSKPVKGAIQIVLGALLLLLAVVQWRRRPRAGEEPRLPKWMQAIDRVAFPTALGLGLLLSALNPKNLLMIAGAGVSIGAAHLSVGAIVVVMAIFTLIASSTVLVPVVGYLAAADRLRKPLDALRVWLGRENTVIMAILLLVIGVDLIGKGIGAF